MNISKGTLRTIAGLAFAGLAVVAAPAMHSALQTQTEGQQWLENEGYRNVTGGEEVSFWFNGCNTKHDVARTYTVSSQDDVQQEKVVCMGLFGNYLRFYQPVQN